MIKQITRGSTKIHKGLIEINMSVIKGGVLQHIKIKAIKVPKSENYEYKIKVLAFGSIWYADSGYDNSVSDIIKRALN